MWSGRELGGFTYLALKSNANESPARIRVLCHSAAATTSMFDSTSKFKPFGVNSG